MAKVSGKYSDDVLHQISEFTSFSVKWRQTEIALLTTWNIDNPSVKRSGCVFSYGWVRHKNIMCEGKSTFEWYAVSGLVVWSTWRQQSTRQDASSSRIHILHTTAATQTQSAMQFSNSSIGWYQKGFRNSTRSCSSVTSSKNEEKNCVDWKNKRVFGVTL